LAKATLVAAALEEPAVVTPVLTVVVVVRLELPPAELED
jgi:hypothetical protein